MKFKSKDEEIFWQSAYLAHMDFLARTAPSPMSGAIIKDANRLMIAVTDATLLAFRARVEGSDAA